MSKLTYNGPEMTVRIGRRWLEPGDTVGEGDCDEASLEYLASRSDFSGGAESSPETERETVFTVDVEE